MKASLHIGLNMVDPVAYGGWPGWLQGCVNDAALMATTAARFGFTATSMLNDRATISGVTHAILELAKRSKAGDSILITDSSHGGRGESWSSAYKETLCLFDGQLADTGFLAALAEFPADVRVYVILDCCHSGGMNRGSLVRALPEFVHSSTQGPAITISRALAAIQADVVMLCACRDNEYAFDGPVNGAFTGTLHSVLEKLMPDRPSWTKLKVETALAMAKTHPTQHPTIHLIGPNAQRRASEPVFF